MPAPENAELLGPRRLRCRPHRTDPATVQRGRGPAPAVRVVGPGVSTRAGRGRVPTRPFRRLSPTSRARAFCNQAGTDPGHPPVVKPGRRTETGEAPGRPGRRPRIPGVFEGGATPPARTHRPPNVARVAAVTADLATTPCLAPAVREPPMMLGYSKETSKVDRLPAVAPKRDRRGPDRMPPPACGRCPGPDAVVVHARSATSLSCQCLRCQRTWQLPLPSRVTA